ncbi:MAG: DUF1801 domain-containing protein [SAR324 cluster bacterium]|nr:DUF1801 domain-containing protein [SAR324 cluster bacterium]
MVKLKTTKNNRSVDVFLEQADPKRREDSQVILDMMREITGEQPAMWGTSIIGFGSYHYKYQSGHEGDSFLTGFSPRKQSLTLYIMPGFSKYESLLNKIGKHKTGKSCLYINKLSDIDLSILREILEDSYSSMIKKYK